MCMYLKKAQHVVILKLIQFQHPKPCKLCEPGFSQITTSSAAALFASQLIPVCLCLSAFNLLTQSSQVVKHPSCISGHI